MNRRNSQPRAARILALVMTLIIAAGSLASCSAGPFDNIGNKFTVDLPEITLKTKEEITADGITAEDVLARYDMLSKKVATALTETSDLLTEDDINGQFTSITVGQRLVTDVNLTATDKYYVKDTWFLPEVAAKLADKAKDKSTFSPYITGETDEAYMGHTYMVSFNYVSESFGIGCNETVKSWGIFSIPFEKLMDALEAENHTFSEEDLPEEGYSEKGKKNSIYSEYAMNTYKDKIGRIAYEPITIDRKLIEGATEDQLWALYNMADSMEMTNFEGKLPDGCIDITVTNEDDYNGEKTVAKYSCHKVPKVITKYNSDGSLKEQYEFTFTGDGKLTELKYFENTISVPKIRYKQEFSEEGKLTKAVYTVAYEGYEVYTYDNADYSVSAYNTDYSTGINPPETFVKVAHYNTSDKMEYYIEREYQSSGSYIDRTYNPDGSIRY